MRLYIVCLGLSVPVLRVNIVIPIYFKPCMNYGYHEIVFLFSHGHGRIRVFSVKVALSHLCSGKLIDKLRCKYDFKVNGCVCKKLIEWQIL